MRLKNVKLTKQEKLDLLLRKKVDRVIQLYDEMLLDMDNDLSLKLAFGDLYPPLEEGRELWRKAREEMDKP